MDVKTHEPGGSADDVVYAAEDSTLPIQYSERDFATLYTRYKLQRRANRIKLYGAAILACAASYGVMMNYALTESHGYAIIAVFVFCAFFGAALSHWSETLAIKSTFPHEEVLVCLISLSGRMLKKVHSARVGRVRGILVDAAHHKRVAPSDRVFAVETVGDWLLATQSTEQTETRFERLVHACRKPDVSDERNRHS